MITKNILSLLRRLLAVCLAIACLVLVSACRKNEETDAVRVIFFDVGQGNAALIRTPDGDVLIDAGGEATEAFLCGRLREMGVDELALLILTTSANESIGGADGVLKEFGARNVWYNGGFVENESAERLGQVLRESSVPWQSVNDYSTFALGGVRLSVLFPFAQEPADENIVVQLLYGSFSALWMGYAAKEVESQLCATYRSSILQSDLLVVGRHGSNTLTGEAFLEALSPQYAVISCGANNLYGYPTGELLERLAASDVQVLRTDRHGDIVFVDSGNGLCLPEEWEK